MRSGPRELGGSSPLIVGGPPESIRVVVADKHPLFCQGVVAALTSDSGVVVVGQATDTDRAARVVQAERPDIVLLDAALPGGGIDAARRIATASPATRIVLLTVSGNEDELRAALSAGASGYVCKDILADELAEVVHSVHNGKMYAPPALAFRLLRDIRRPRTADRLAHLTARERQVLELVASGLSNQEIAVKLGLAENTVKKRMTSLFRKLPVDNRVQLALVALRAGVGQEGSGPTSARQRWN